MDIISYIGVGRENAVTRAQLCALTGRADRSVRRHIEKARNSGALIISDKTGKGYYIATSPSELLSQIMENKSRALSILAHQKHLRQAYMAMEMESIGQTEVAL